MTRVPATLLHPDRDARTGHSCANAGLDHSAIQDGSFVAFAPLSWCIESGTSLEGIPLRLWRVLLPSRAVRAVQKHCDIFFSCITVGC